MMRNAAVNGSGTAKEITGEIARKENAVKEMAMGKIAVMETAVEESGVQTGERHDSNGCSQRRTNVEANRIIKLETSYK